MELVQAIIQTFFPSSLYIAATTNSVMEGTACPVSFKSEKASNNYNDEVQ